MRLIDANALKYRRKEFGGYDDVPMEERKKGILYLLKEDIDDALTISPVKHGKWIEKMRPTTSKKAAVCECSLCGDTVWVYDGDRSWNYCPTCGARMNDDKT